LIRDSLRRLCVVTIVSVLWPAGSRAHAQSAPPVAYGPSCSALAGVGVGRATVTYTLRFVRGTFDPRRPAQQTATALPPFGDLPEFCRAEVTGGPSSEFRTIEVWIPTHSWNGKLMMVGRDRSGKTVDLGRMAVALSGGFAAASLDTTTPAAIHEATNAVNQLLAAYFGPESKWIYWSGCGASARDGLLAAERYPDVFDGILAGGLSEAKPAVPNATSTTSPRIELEAYRARNGKVLIYDTIDSAASALLPLRETGAIRVSLKPGQPSCPDVDDGQTAVLARTLESWVERGTTPDRLNAAHQAIFVSQISPLAIGETFTIASQVLGESRRINVYRPPVFGQPADAPLPVLYMPDGGLAEDFLHVAGLVQVSVGNGTMRPFLLVGIENTQRRRDLTGPTESAEDKKIAPVVGGSEIFRRFIRAELMPAVTSRYRTTAETAIIGESLAGLFIVETFFLEPGLFNTYIAFDPSLWWNNGALVKSAADRLRARASRPATLYLAASREDRSDFTKQFAGLLRANAPATVTWHFEPMPNETHATIYHPAALAAFRYLFTPKGTK
jgi:uncharacterized protein